MTRIYLYFVNKHLASWLLLGLKSLQNVLKCFFEQSRKKDLKLYGHFLQKKDELVKH